MGIEIGMQLKSFTARGRIAANPQFASVCGVHGIALLNWQALLEWEKGCLLQKGRTEYVLRHA